MRRLLFVSVLGVAALALTAPAQAQTRGWLDDGRSYVPAAQESYYNSGRVAYDNGFREGLKEGEKDGKKQDNFRYQDEKTFQRADKGYHREYGSIERYRQSFRTGFAAGYNEGYQRYVPNYGYGNGRYGNGRAVPRGDVGGGYGYPGYPSNRPVDPSYPGPSYPGPYGGYGGYTNTAFQNGVNEGYEKGQEDARKNRSFDPLRHEWYRSGDRHYDSRYGSRQQYEDVYRQGFRDGYERGFREWRY
jgi:flagellar biosynthesis/type III secretory pathway protein FliH